MHLLRFWVCLASNPRNRGITNTRNVPTCSSNSRKVPWKLAMNFRLHPTSWKWRGAPYASFPPLTASRTAWPGISIGSHGQTSTKRFSYAEGKLTGLTSKPFALGVSTKELSQPFKNFTINSAARKISPGRSLDHPQTPSSHCRGASMTAHPRRRRKL